MRQDGRRGPKRTHSGRDWTAPTLISHEHNQTLANSPVRSLLRTNIFFRSNSNQSSDPSITRGGRKSKLVRLHSNAAAGSQNEHVMSWWCFLFSGTPASDGTIFAYALAPSRSMKTAQAITSEREAYKRANRWEISPERNVFKQLLDNQQSGSQRLQPEWRRLVTTPGLCLAQSWLF